MRHQENSFITISHVVLCQYAKSIHQESHHGIPPWCHLLITPPDLGSSYLWTIHSNSNFISWTNPNPGKVGSHIWLWDSSLYIDLPSQLNVCHVLQVPSVTRPPVGGGGPHHEALPSHCHSTGQWGVLSGERKAQASLPALPKKLCHHTSGHPFDTLVLEKKVYGRS